MTTLRSATMGGGARRKAQQSHLRQLLGATIRGGFLLPKGFKGTWHQPGPMLKYYVIVG